MPELKTPSTLSFSNLGCQRSGKRLFQDVTSTLAAGRWMHVAGPNGVGKTSLLRMICGLAPVEMGAILWNGQAIHTQQENYRQDLCYLGHLNALQESLSVQENLSFYGALNGIKTDFNATNAILEQFGLRGRGSQLVRHLSQGQKRRVALSRLAFSRAQLWVLDEPFVAMDESGIKMLSELIATHLGTGGLVVLTSHQQVHIGNIPVQCLELVQ
jgi:heme exporter protein A